MKMRSQVIAIVSLTGLLGVGAYTQVSAALTTKASTVTTTAVNTDDTAQVAAIIDRMANAIDHYDAVTASVEAHWYGETTVTDKADLMLRIRPLPGARSDATFGNGRKVVQVNDGHQLLELFAENTYRLFDVNPNASKYSPIKAQVAMTKKGPAFAYRELQAWASMSGMADVLHPQQEALGIVSRSTTTVASHEQLLDRKAIKLKIVPSEIHQDLWDLVHYWVDEDTGILLKQEYWKGGKLLEDRVVTQLTINPSISQSQFEIQIPKAATKLPMPG